MSSDYPSGTLPDTIIASAVLILVTCMFLGITLIAQNTIPESGTSTPSISGTPPADVLPDLPPITDNFWFTVLCLVGSHCHFLNGWLQLVTGTILAGQPLNNISLMDLRSIVHMIYVYHQVVFDYLSLHADYLEARNLPLTDTAQMATTRWMRSGSAVLFLFRLIEVALRIGPEQSSIPRQEYEDY